VTVGIYSLLCAYIENKIAGTQMSLESFYEASAAKLEQQTTVEAFLKSKGYRNAATANVIAVYLKLATDTKDFKVHYSNTSGNKEGKVYIYDAFLTHYEDYVRTSGSDISLETYFTDVLSATKAIREKVVGSNKRKNAAVSRNVLSPTGAALNSPKHPRANSDHSVSNSLML
jgi:hypothetical protein